MNLITMSIAGGLMILATAAIRLLGLSRLPKGMFTVLWTIIICRLLIPFSLPFVGSAYTMLANIFGGGKSNSISGIANTEFMFSTLPYKAGEIIAAQTGTPSAVNPLTIIWLSGAVLFALYFVFSYFRIRRRFSYEYAVDCRDTMRATGIKIIRPVTVYISSAVKVPLTYGVFRPVILLPKDTDLTDTERIRAVLAHEIVHIKKFHAIYKLVLVATLCVHWFNPLVWFMLILANRDIELACDETVLRTLGVSERRAYARTLLDMEEQKSGLIPMFNSFSKYALEERICSIMKYKRITIASVMLALILVVGVTIAFATSGAIEAEEPELVAAESYVEEIPADDLTLVEDVPSDESNDEVAPAELEPEFEAQDTEPQLLPLEIEFGTSEDGVLTSSETRTIYLSVQDTVGEMGEERTCSVRVELSDDSKIGLGANSVGVLKFMVQEYLDGKITVGAITQEEADKAVADAMANVSFE